jgi:hypothetical protein
VHDGHRAADPTDPRSARKPCLSRAIAFASLPARGARPLCTLAELRPIADVVPVADNFPTTSRLSRSRQSRGAGQVLCNRQPQGSRLLEGAASGPIAPTGERSFGARNQIARGRQCESPNLFRPSPSVRLRRSVCRCRPIAVRCRATPLATRESSARRWGSSAWP